MVFVVALAALGATPSIKVQGNAVCVMGATLPGQPPCQTAPCGATDYPDTPASAIKIGGEVCLYSGNGGYPNYRSCGSSLDSLKRICSDIGPHSPKDCANPAGYEPEPYYTRTRA